MNGAMSVYVPHPWLQSMSASDKKDAIEWEFYKTRKIVGRDFKGHEASFTDLLLDHYLGLAYASTVNGNERLRKEALEITEDRASQFSNLKRFWVDLAREKRACLNMARFDFTSIGLRQIWMRLFGPRLIRRYKATVSA